MSKELQYHVRKSWEDVASQIGIDYNFLVNAQKACDKLEGYAVFDSNGVQVYPEVIEEIVEMAPIVLFDAGAEVQIAPGALYANGAAVHEDYIGEKMVVKYIDNGNYVLGRTRKSPPIGTVKAEYVMPYAEQNAAVIDPYYVSVIADKAVIKMDPSTTSRIINTVPKYSFYKIINEKDNWGKLEMGAGWINLDDVRKV